MDSKSLGTISANQRCVTVFSTVDYSNNELLIVSLQIMSFLLSCGLCWFIELILVYKWGNTLEKRRSNF